MADIIVLPPRGPGVVGNVAFEVAEEVVERAIDAWLATKESLTETEKQVIKITNGVRKAVILIVEGAPKPLDFLEVAGPITLTDVINSDSILAKWIKDGWQFSAGDGLRVWTPSMGEDP